jgi:hypothetical protein
MHKLTTQPLDFPLFAEVREQGRGGDLTTADGTEDRWQTEACERCGNYNSAVRNMMRKIEADCGLKAPSQTQSEILPEDVVDSSCSRGIHAGNVDEVGMQFRARKFLQVPFDCFLISSGREEIDLAAGSGQVNSPTPTCPRFRSGVGPAYVRGENEFDSCLAVHYSSSHL